MYHSAIHAWVRSDTDSSISAQIDPSAALDVSQPKSKYVGSRKLSGAPPERYSAETGNPYTAEGI